MPKPAQDRIQKGPLAALLILLGLLLGSGNAVASGSGAAGPAARTSLGRQGSSAALLHHSSARASFEDEASDGSPPLLAERAGIVTTRLWTLQPGASAATVSALRPQPGDILYRARAPPAA